MFIDNALLFIDNSNLNVSSWIPDIFDSSTKVKSNSWFNIDKTKNPSILNNYNYRFNDLDELIDNPLDHDIHYKSKLVKAPILPLPKFVRGKIKESEFIYANNIRIYPTHEQSLIFHKWFDAFTKVYNITINYINQHIYINGKFNIKIAKNIVNFISIRAILKTKRDKIIKSLPISERIPSHILDEAINHAVKNCKASITSVSNGNYNQFRIREWKYNRDRKILIIESNYFRNNTLCSRIFPKLKNSDTFNNINKTCTLQYNKSTGKYILFVPKGITKDKQILEYKKINRCGIDLGARTFATVYSESNTHSICDNAVNKLKKQYIKLDKIQNQFNDNVNDDFCTKNEINNRNKILKKARLKYHKKIKDKIKDMHYKVSKYICDNHDEVYVGKISTSRILSQSELSSKNKRIVQSLSWSKFINILKYMGEKTNTKVIEVNEYLTSQLCSNCGKLKKVGKDKVYECAHCGMRSDRDVNASKNILKRGLQ